MNQNLTRAHITAAPVAQEQISGPIENTESDQNLENPENIHTLEPDQNEILEQPQNQEKTRSRRKRKPPDHLRDYIVDKNLF